MTISGIQLKRLHDDGIKLLNFLRMRSGMVGENNDEYTELYNDFLSIMRKISIANIFAKKRVVCISGLQGQGKTTMVRNMYADKSGKKLQLKANLGRGEKLPVFITEHNDSNVIYVRKYYKQSQENVELVEEFIDYEEFEKLVGDADQNTVIFEVRVPQRYFSDNGDTGFLLLPGFEERKNIYFDDPETEYWKVLVDFCTACADVNLFVTQSTTLANNEIKIVKEKLKGNGLLKNSIFMISYSESLDNEAKEGVIDNCAKIFEKSVDECKDNVIFIGDNPYGNPKNDWCEQLVARMQSYICPYNEISTKQNEYIKRVICDDLGRINYRIGCLINDLSIKMGDNDSSLNRYERIIDEEWKTIERNYRNALKDNLKKARGATIRNIEDLMAGEYKPSHWEKFKKHIFGTSFKNHLDHKRMLQKALLERHDNNGESLIAVANTSALNAIASTSTDRIRKLSDNRILNSEGKEVALIGEKCTRDIAILIGSEEASFENANLNNTLRIVLNLAFAMYQRNMEKGTSANIGMLSTIIVNENELAEIKMPPFEQQLADLKGTILTGMGFMGIAIDAGPDGKIDIVPALAELLGISSEVVMGGLALGGIAYVVSNYVKASNEREIMEYIQNVNIINDIYAETQNAYLDNLNKLKDDLKQKIMERLYVLIGAGQSSADYINARICYKNVQEDIRELEKGLYSNAQLLGTAL